MIDVFFVEIDKYLLLSSNNYTGPDFPIPVDTIFKVGADSGEVIKSVIKFPHVIKIIFMKLE